MKHFFAIGLLLSVSLLIQLPLFAQVKIGGAPSAPPSSAILEIDGGTNKTLLLPRLTSLQINNIASPVAGLLAYATDAQALFYYDGSKWRELREPLPGFSLPHVGVYVVNNAPVLHLTNNGTNATAIRGISSEGAGIWGQSNEGTGVRGETLNGFGAWTTSIGGAALYSRAETGSSAFITHGSATGRGLIVEQGRVGIGTFAPATRLHVANDDVLFTGPATPQNTPVPISGAGRRFMWLANKAALRVGIVSGTQWNTDSIGDASIAMGRNTVAKQQGSVAIGIHAAARGEASIAIGTDITAAAQNSTLAIGNQSAANAENASVIGYQSIASGIAAVAIGNELFATGNQSVALGRYASASAENTVAIGYDIGTDGNVRTGANQPNSVAIGGVNTRTVNGPSGVAIGYSSEAGNSAVSIGVIALARAPKTVGIGEFVSMGEKSVAIGRTSAQIESFSLGYSIGARSFREVSLGSFNTNYTPAGIDEFYDLNDRLLSIGYPGPADAPRNSLVILKRGYAGLNTSVPTTELHLVHGISAPGTVTNGFKINNNGANNNRWTIYTLNSNGNLELYFNDAPAAKGWFSSSTGAYTASSARHLKTGFTPLSPNSLAQVMQLQPWQYRYKADPSGKKTLGFKAEDAAKIVPELVEASGEGGSQLGINYSGFSVLAIKAIQELEAEIASLTAEVQQLLKKTEKK
jgi:hypothetical protein